jgi:hypothetical protein
MLAQGKITTERDVIISWAHARQGQPALVRKGQGPALAIIFPDCNPALVDRKLSWNEFFEQFEHQKLVFMYQDTDQNQELSRYFVFI